jgi:hypothetical protein
LDETDQENGSDGAHASDEGADPLLDDGDGSGDDEAPAEVSFKSTKQDAEQQQHEFSLLPGGKQRR